MNRKSPEYLTYDARPIIASLALSEEFLVDGDRTTAEGILRDIPPESINLAVGRLSFHAAIVENIGTKKEFFADLRMLERLAMFRVGIEYSKNHESFDLWSAQDDEIATYWEMLAQMRNLYTKSQRLFRRRMIGIDLYGISALLTLAVSYESVLMVRNELLRDKEIGKELEVHRSLIDDLANRWLSKKNRGEPRPYGQ